MHESRPPFSAGGESGEGRMGKRDPPLKDSKDGTIGRRRLLQWGTGVLFVGVAGCTDTGTDAADDGDDGGSADADAEPAIAVTDATVSDSAIYIDEAIEVTGTVENDGDQRGTIYAELRIDGTITDTKEVTVDAGETESVTFTGTFSEPGEYEISVNDAVAGTVRVERRPPEFEIRDTSVERTTVAVGEEVVVRATVANVGGKQGAFTAELQVDGLTVETRDVTIDAGEEADVPFSYAFDSPGKYELGINGETIDAVNVEPPAEFEVTATSMDRTTVRVGRSVEVKATIANTGGLEGTFTATLEADGEPVATREVTVPPGETETIRFSVDFEERGAYVLGVSGVDVGILYVTECSVAVDERITVDSRSEQTYEFDLKERVEVAITAETRDGVDPTLSVVGPSSTLVEGTTDDAIDGTVTTVEAGRHEIRFENDAFLPWRSGTWDVRIEICTW